VPGSYQEYVRVLDELERRLETVEQRGAVRVTAP
jgi:hypothetical protein